jgi:hypothetical protein
MSEQRTNIQPLANRAILVAIIGGFFATIGLVVWTLVVVKTSDFGEGSTYGWTAWAKNLPAVVAMFAPPILGYVWGFRATRNGETNGPVAIIVSGVVFFWALLITHLAGLVDAFGDSPDWTGVWYFLLKVLIAMITTVVVLRAARRQSS